MLRWVRSKLDRVLASGGIEALRATEVTASPGRATLDRKIPNHQKWMPGDVIEGIYTVKRAFQEGGMGLVYQVHHRDWGTDLAVKCPRLEYFQTEKQREAFINECQTWITLGLHPNVAACHYVRSIEGVPCVFAEFVDGGSLGDWIAQRRLYSADQVETLLRILDVGIQFAHGINYAHQNGIIHRDVKPSNALLTARGQLKVTDFGLARAITAVAERGSLGTSSGRQDAEWLTPAYSSPEQGSRGPISQATDVWSWAVSLLEVFVGDITWNRGPAAEAALEEYLQRGPLHHEIPTMPEPVVRLMRNCLDTNPTKRPSSMTEIAGVLQACYENYSSGAYPRPVPKGLPLGADAFNNRALSYLDLGNRKEALATWERALLSDPRHAESLYNSGLILWRSGSNTDEFALMRISDRADRASNGGNWKLDLFQAQIHAERGDVVSAKNCLQSAARSSADKKTLEQAERAISSVSPGAWDLDLAVLAGHEDEIVGVSFCESGHVISASRDRTLRLWDVHTQNCLNVLQGHSEEICCLFCLPDSYLAFSGDRDGILNEWNLRTGERRNVTNDSQINCVVSNGRGQTALGDAEGRVKLWNASTNRLTIIGTHADAVVQLDFSTDSQVLISRSFDGTEKRWLVSEMSRDSQRTEPNPRETDSRSPSVSRWKTRLKWERVVDSVDWVSPDGQRGWAHDVANDRSALLLRQFITDGPRCVCSLRFPFPEFVKAYKRKPTSFCVNQSGTRWCAGLADGTVVVGSLPDYFAPSPSPYAVSRVMPMADVWSTEDRLAKICKEAERLIDRCDWERARSLLLREIDPSVETSRHISDLWKKLGRKARRTKVLKVQYRVPVDTETTHTLVNEATPSKRARGRFVIYSNHAGGVFLRDTTSGLCFQSFAGHRGEILDMAVSPDDSVAVSCSSDGTVRFWDLVNRRCAKVFRGQSAAQKVAFNPCAAQLAVGCQNGSVLLFDTSTLSDQELIRCDSGSVNSLVFTPDGQFLLIGSSDLAVLDLESKDCTILTDGPVAVTRVSSDGFRVESAGGTHSLWELFWDYDYPCSDLLLPPILGRLTVFLEQHRPFTSSDPFDPAFLRRGGTPQWSSADFADLMADLAERGIGWASSEAIESGLRDQLRALHESGSAEATS